jgi:hypothetical protein
LADPPTWATGRTHRALLIGNGRLGGASERFGQLRSPPGDVAALRAALTDAERGLHARRHVQVVLDAPRERVLAALRAFFDGAGPRDQLLLFYSGHGLADERGALHLGTSDTMAQFPVSTAVPAEAVGQLADTSPAAAVLIILDCRYGDAWPRSPSAPLAGTKRLVLASPFGVPRADDDDRVSAFTEVVAAGLTAGRAADRNRDGLVSFAELCEFVTAELTEAGDPPPECWLSNTGADVPIARVDDPAVGGSGAEPEWHLPGEEAPLVPAADAPGARRAPEPSFPPAPRRAEPPSRRVPVRAALPAGPPASPVQPGGQAPDGTAAAEPPQAAALAGPANGPDPGRLADGPTGWAEQPDEPATGWTEQRGQAATGWVERRGASSTGWAEQPAQPPTGWAEQPAEPATGWVEQRGASTAGSERHAGPFATPRVDPAPEPGPGPPWPNAPWPNGRVAGPGPAPKGGAAAAPQEPSGPSWPDGLAAGQDADPEVESNPYRPLPAGLDASAAAQRAFPTEILPPGRRGPAGHAGAQAASVTAAPGPVRTGSGRDRSRRGSVAPTDIHRPGPQAAGGDRTGPITNLPLAGSRPLEAGDWLMAEIRSRVVERGERVLTLVGPGAVGPASPMVRYAGQHAGEYQVCWWLRAHDPALLAEDWRSLATELGLPAHSDLLRAVPALRGWLEDERHGPWLLVLDGAPAPEEIGPYVPKAGRGQVLITATTPGWEELSSSTPLSMARPRAAEPGRLGAPPGPRQVPPTRPAGPPPRHDLPAQQGPPPGAPGPPPRRDPMVQPGPPPGPAPVRDPPVDAGPPLGEPSSFDRPPGPKPPRPEPPPVDDPWVERRPPRPRPATGEQTVQQPQPAPGPPVPGQPPAQRPPGPEPPPVDDPWVERRPPRAWPATGEQTVQQPQPAPGPPVPGQPPAHWPPHPAAPVRDQPAQQGPPALGPPRYDQAPPAAPPPLPGRPVPPRRAGARGEPIQGEPVPPGSAAAGQPGWPAEPAGPYEPVNGRTGGPRPAGEGVGASGRQEVLHWDQALKRLRRASPQAAALLQLAAFLDSEAIPVGLLAMTGVVLPGELGASLRDPRVFRAALATLAQRGMVAHAGDRLAVPPLAQVAVGSALGGEGVRTWAAYALRVLGIVLALPAGDGERPVWAEPSRLLPHAEAAARHALALGVRTPELPTVLNEIGVHLLRMQRPDLAVPYLDRALGLAREVHGLRHREVVRALDHLALAHRQLGDEALAMRLHGEALAISRSLDRRLMHDRGPYPGHP